MPRFGIKKWKALLALAVIYLAIVTGHYWLWGALLLVMVVQDIEKGRTHLLEEVVWDEEPVLFILIEVTWLAMASYVILWDFYPQLFH